MSCFKHLSRFDKSEVLNAAKAIEGDRKQALLKAAEDILADYKAQESEIIGKVVERHRLPDLSNVNDKQVIAKRQGKGDYKLVYVDSGKEVFPNQQFQSVKEARAYFNEIKQSQETENISEQENQQAETTQERAEAAEEGSLKDFINKKLNESRYRDSYEKSPKLLEQFKDTAKEEWKQQVESATERLSDHIIDEYIKYYGIDSLYSRFRGIHEPAISGWFSKDIREQKTLNQRHLKVFDKKIYERTWPQQLDEIKKSVSRNLGRKEIESEKKYWLSQINIAMYNGEEIPDNVLKSRDAINGDKNDDQSMQRMGINDQGGKNENENTKQDNITDSFGSGARERAAKEKFAGFTDDELNEIEAKRSEIKDINGWARGRFGADRVKGIDFNSDIPKAESKIVEATNKAAGKITDFGEKIGGAKKDIWSSYKDKMDDAIKEDVESVPLSKSWPEPDYQALIDNGIDPFIVAFVRSARDEIPTKPQKSWKLRSWVDSVKLLRETSNKLLNGDISPETLKARAESRIEPVMNRVELYQLVGHEKSLKGIRLVANAYTLYNGITYKPAKIIWSIERDAKATEFGNWPRQFVTDDTKDGVLKEFKEKYDTLELNDQKKEVSFNIYSRHDQKGFWIGKKIGRNVAWLSGPFDNIKDARAYKTEHNKELVEKLEKFKEIPRERRDINEPRVGVDMRGGADVTQAMFEEAFGFRGVEFGNWVNSKERQQDLNESFDALMDMAAILNIPPKSLSLNGELGLAFGARGSGGIYAAKAHYEPEKVVINLTKKKGAGSLGHEWWHSLDNYFSRMRNKKSDMMTTSFDVSNTSYDKKVVKSEEGVREEMIKAYGDILRTVRNTALKSRSSKLDAKRSGKAYWTTQDEMSARAFESYLISKLQDQNASNDYLANIVDEDTWNAAASLGFELDDSYPYPTAGEIPSIRAAFDNFFNVIEHKDTDKGIALYSKGNNQSPLSTKEELLNLLDSRDKKLLNNGKLHIVQHLIDIPEEMISGGKPVQSINAFHGSPYDHNKFDSRNIGTGEGAQAFGYGHYFTDKKEIAEFYRDILSKDVSLNQKEVERLRKIIGGKYNSYITGFSIEESGNKFYVIFENSDGTTKKRDWAYLSKEEAEINASSDIGLPVLSGFVVKEEAIKRGLLKGKLYQVELVPNEDELLDWDKPLSEQSEKVKDILSSKNYPNKEWNTGKKIYEQSAPKGSYRNNTERDKAASDYLHSLGIRGIRYKAEGGKSDAYNYVIFSDDDINIKEKYSKNISIEGFYNNGNIWLIADNVSKESFRGVLNHEYLHAAIDQSPKLKERLFNSQAELRDIFNRVEKGTYRGRYKELYDAALKRVDKAGTKDSVRFEEWLAYQVTEYSKNPASLPEKLAKAIKSFIAAIRALMFKYTGVINNITPADLVALSRSSLNYSKNPNNSNAVFMASKQGYKGSDSGEAEEWIRAKAKGLDMSQEARMERAKAMGFITHSMMQQDMKGHASFYGDDKLQVFYHGGPKDFDMDGFKEASGSSFYNPNNIKAGYGFFTSSKGEAQGYANELKVKKGIKTAVHEFLIRKNGPSKVIDTSTGNNLPDYRQLKEQGFGQTIVNLGKYGKGDDDNYYRHEWLLPYDDYQIRSINAAFDPDYADSPNLLASKKSNDIRFSISDDVKSFLTDRDKPIKTLAELDAAMQSGKLPQSSLDWQYIKDKTATLLVDSTRPVTVWLRNIPDKIAAGQVQLALDRVKTRTRALEEVARNKYLEPLSKEIAAIAKETKWDYALTKDVIGHWMTARYAIEKNADYIQQDQKAVDDAQAALNQNPNDSALKGALTRAKNKQQKRLDAINEQRHIDPNEESLAAGLAGGYNNFTAKEQMAKYERAIPRAKLESAAKHIYAMLEWKKQTDIKNGKVTQDIVDKWQNSTHYVPLTGDPSVDEGDNELFQHGNINQSKDKKAEGRKASLAQNGIDAAVEQVQKSARYHGWVDFKDNFTTMVDKLIGEKIKQGMNQDEAEKAVYDDYKIERFKEKPMALLSDTQFTIRKNGENWVYDIHNSDVINALKSTNKEDTPSFLTLTAGFTRSYAYLVTQLMPGFSQINAIRDTWERTENIRTRTLPGYETIDMDKVARNAINVAIDPRTPLKIASVLTEGKVKFDQTDPDIALIKEMIAEGGASSIGYYLAGNNLDLAKQLESQNTKLKKVSKLISDYNNSFELISSFSIYKALKAHGVDKKTAASGTLNLMNFTKSGTAIGPLRALYAFINPTMQGGHQMIQSLSSRKGQARAGAYLLAGILLYSALRALDGDDDELGVNKMDQQSNFVIERNIPIPLGDGTYLKVPMGFGMPQAMWSAAVNIVKALSGSQSTADAAAEIIKSFSRTLAPVQPSETSITQHPIYWALQTGTPQIAKPFVNIAIDRTMFGQPLTNSKFAKQDTALALQGRRTTAGFYKDIAKQLGKMGIPMYPEQVREIIRGYGVGIFNEIIKATVENPNREALGKETVNNLIDRYIAIHDSKSVKERMYYNYLDQLQQISSKSSLGKELSGKEKRLLLLYNRVNKMQHQASGKFAAASKAEKKGIKRSPFRAEGERLQEQAMTITINQFAKIE